MLLTWFLGGVAVGAVIYAIHTRRDLIEARKEYDVRSNALIIALEEIGKLKSLYEDAESEMKALNDAIANHKAAEFNGRNNLTWIEEIPSAANREFVCHASVIVIGQDKKSGFYFVVKAFRYQLNDPEDRDFAIRQAEELIETIQNF